MSGNKEVIDHTVDVKELGRKAKARLEEENAKRHEIVRLEAESTDPSRKERTNIHLFEPSTKRKEHNVSVDRRKKLRGRRSVGTRDYNVSDDVDRWAPKIPHLMDDSSNTSNLLMVHGLPYDCTPKHIMRFFSGLEPQKVLVLLPQERRIPELDPLENTSPRRLPEVERLEYKCRVLVMFRKASFATEAKQRSGEPILTDSKPASTTITQVDNDLSQFFIKNLATEAEHGIPLMKTLSNTQGVPKVALGIVWSEAFRRFRLCGYSESIHDSIINSPQPKLGEDEIHALTKTIEELSNRQDALERDSPCWCADPELLKNPSYRVTRAAKIILTQRISEINTALRKNRQWKSLQALDTLIREDPGDPELSSL